MIKQSTGRSPSCSVSRRPRNLVTPSFTPSSARAAATPRAPRKKRAAHERARATHTHAPQVMHRVSECHRHLRACVRALRRAGTSSLTHRAAVQHRAAIRAASVCEESDMRVCATALKRAESEPPLLYFGGVVDASADRGDHVCVARHRPRCRAHVVGARALDRAPEQRGRGERHGAAQHAPARSAPATSLGAHEFNDRIVLTPSVSRVLKQLLELLQEMRREPEGGAARRRERQPEPLLQPPPSPRSARAMRQHRQQQRTRRRALPWCRGLATKGRMARVG